ncbi:MAG: MerR family transcriptional regulator [Candidatus Binatia bacterium]|nr:MerR family transcriptional regulator [Candidatus Binatia bacterium]
MDSAPREALAADAFDVAPVDDTETPLPPWAEEALTPEQFFSLATESRRHWTGERRLLLAVLQNAVDELLRYRDARTTRGRRLFRETRDWFWSREHTYLCAFETICAYLHLDADYVRQGLERLLDSRAPSALPAAARPERPLSPPPSLSPQPAPQREQTQDHRSRQSRNTYSQPSAPQREQTQDRQKERRQNLSRTGVVCTRAVAHVERKGNTVVGQRGGQVGGKLSIGALSRATGIPVETLRTWERRYGFPTPERKPSGHRVYSLSSVPRLRRIAEALAQGHRAGEAVTASEADLEALLAIPPAVATSAPTALPRRDTEEVADLFSLVEAFDAPRLTRVLADEWRRLGPLECLCSRIVPLVRAVGEAWETARLEIRHEHFLSERLSDFLRARRLAFERRAHGPLVVCVTLPGEAHSLGLQMVALLLAQAGCRVLYLGTEVPVGQIAGVARDFRARAVAVSISSANQGGAMVVQVERLRALLPRRVTLLLGGDGAPAPRPGMKVIQDLPTLAAWGRQLVAATSQEET